MSTNFRVAAHILEPGNERTLTFFGRDAWALCELVQAGLDGITPITHPAPRWSAYVFNLRTEGISIETVHERHAGAFPGCHARYVLRARVKLEVANDGAAE